MDRAKLSKLHDLTGRVAIVTGGTRGIGLAIAEGLLAAGAKVAVASRKADACAATEAHLRSQGGEAIGVATHMGDIDAINTLVDRTVAEFGRLDIVVNNAANALTLPFGHLTVEAWEKSLGTNLRGPVFLVERALPHLGGVGQRGGAQRRLGRRLPVLGEHRDVCGGEGGPDGHDAIDGGGIRREGHPGQRARARHGRHRHGPQQSAGAVESMSKAAFMRRAAHADEMVGPALLLCSDAGSFITGQVLIVDGGLTPH